MSKLVERTNTDLLESLDANLPFVSELLQADIKLFAKEEASTDIFIHNYYHPSQDSLFSKPPKGMKLEKHKDIPVQKAFETANPVIGQYGLVINNRPIQEFAYPLFCYESVAAVVAVERDIYLTRSILGQHWDLIADTLIKALQEKIFGDAKFPSIAPGEGALIVKNDDSIFFANPLATSLLSEIAENSSQLINRPLDDLFAGYQIKEKGTNQRLSIDRIQEIKLKQKTVSLRHIQLSEEFSVVLIKDISEIKVRETLLTEIHHRVKNNLQMVVSLLRMQRRRNPEIDNAFKEAISRINSIAQVHDSLSHSTSIELVDFGQLVGSLVKENHRSSDNPALEINFHCPIKVFIRSEHATSLALVINELLMNSMEHAGSSLTQINLEVLMNDASPDNKLLIKIEDNGSGFPENFDYRKDAGLGWEIIRTLAEDVLSAKILITSSDGAEVRLQVPLG